MRPKIEGFVEVGLAALTAIGHGLARHLFHVEFVFILAAIGFWLLYAIVRALLQPDLVRQWGLRSRNLRPAAVACLAAIVGAGGAMIAYGVASGSARFSWNIFPIFGVYLAWAYVQQFVLEAMAARHFRTWMPGPQTVVAVSILFGLSHLPDHTLAGFAALAALFWISIYLRWRNLWPLGVCHAVLGTIALYAVLGFNPSITSQTVVV
jgi:hypothetical protein